MRIFPLAATVAALAGAPLMATDSPKPVHLEVIESPDGVELVVTGAAQVAADTRFELEVDSKGQGGSTRTVQSGVNRKGSAGGVLLRSRIHTSGLAGWTAKLRVQGNGADYSETRSNAG